MKICSSLSFFCKTYGSCKNLGTLVMTNDTCRGCSVFNKRAC